MARRDKEKKKGKSSRRESIRDKARQAAEQREKGGGGLDTLKDIPREMEFFKPKMGKGSKGTNRFSIVPYVVSIKNHPFQEIGELWHECTYWVHTVGVGDDRKKFICLSKTAQSPHKRCPICDYREKLIREGRTKEADELKPKQRQLFNILDHDDEDKGIQLLEMSPHMFGFMLDDEDKAQSHKFEDRFYGDSQDGLLIEARFNEGNYQGNKFAEIARIDFEERDDLGDDLLEESLDLDAALRILSPEELESKFFEMDEDEDPEEEEEKPRSSKKVDKKSGKSKKKEEPEEEEDEDSEEDEEDDVDPEEEPDEEEDSDPDEEPPSRSRKKTEEKTRSSKKSSKSSAGKCPHGGEFGGDCDALDECPDCDKWDDCRDRLDEIEAEQRQKKGGRKKR